MKRLPKIALMLPCLNEAPTLAKVIQDFRRQLPQLDIYVFDNGSTDDSIQIARHHGATVVQVPKRGKGNVVRKMFEVVEADYYVMVDSDDTYDAKGIHALLKPVMAGECDMAVGSRLNDSTRSAFRRLHRLGNRLIQTLINTIFGSRFTDICSGYRAMNRDFVKQIPLLRDGFEVETELTVYSLICGFGVKEIDLHYGARPPGSYSKLKTFKDGYKVVLTIVWLARDLRPLLFFGLFSLFCFFGLALPATIYWPETPLVYQTLMVLSITMFATGLILNTLNVKFSEMYALARRNALRPSDHASTEVITPRATREPPYAEATA